MTDRVNKRVAVVVVDHGSRRAEANLEVHGVARNLAQQLGTAVVAVEPAHMELASPTIADAVGRCVQAGATEIKLLPFFLGPGRHTTTDLPALLDAALAGHPGINGAVGEPLGPDSRLIDILVSRFSTDF